MGSKFPSFLASKLMCTKKRERERVREREERERKRERERPTKQCFPRQRLTL